MDIPPCGSIFELDLRFLRVRAIADLGTPECQLRFLGQVFEPVGTVLCGQGRMGFLWYAGAGFWTLGILDGFDGDICDSVAGNPIGDAAFYGVIRGSGFLAWEVSGGECADECDNCQDVRFADHSNMTFIEERKEFHSDAVILR